MQDVQLATQVAFFAAQQPHFQLENAQHQAHAAFLKAQELRGRRRRHTFRYSMCSLGRRQSCGRRKHRRRHIFKCRMPSCRRRRHAFRRRFGQHNIRRRSHFFDAGGRASSAGGTHSGERIQSWRCRSHSYRCWRYTFSHWMHRMRRRMHLFGRRKHEPHFQLEKAQHHAQEAFFKVQQLCSRRRRHTFIYSMHGLGRTKQSVGCRKHSVMRRRHSGRPAF